MRHERPGARPRRSACLVVFVAVFLLSATGNVPAQKPPAPALLPTAAKPFSPAPQGRAGPPKPVIVTTSALTMTGLALATRTDRLAMTGLAVNVSTDSLVMTGTAGPPLLQQPPSVQTPPSR